MDVHQEGKKYPWATIRIPEATWGKEIVVGIDEAGRGPVVGPLIYAAAFWPKDEDEAISQFAFNDSKQLKDKEREALLKKMIDHPSIGWVVEELDSVIISEEMLRPTPTSLNSISYDAVIRALKSIVRTTNVPPEIGTVFVDTVGDPDYYKSRLEDGLGKDFAEFIIEKKADAKFKVVSAASIVAKVTRDHIIANWEWREQGITLDKSFGSGYPGDDICVQWMNRARQPLFGFPDVVRFSWSTTRDHLINNQAVAVTWECDDEEGNQGANITSFFNVNGSTTQKRKTRPRSTYFQKRKFARISLDSL